PFFDYVRYYRPALFLMENVPGLKTKYEGKLFQRILDVIHSLGYEPSVSILNAVEYGVPQIRKRLFIVGALPRLRFVFPEATHSQNGNSATLPLFDSGRDFQKELKPGTTVRDAIEDLPVIYDGCREDELPYSKDEGLTPFQL